MRLTKKKRFSFAVERALKIEQRKFEADVSSALLTFERAREWADLTSCLNRLHKVYICYAMLRK